MVIANDLFTFNAFSCTVKLSFCRKVTSDVPPQGPYLKDRLEKWVRERERKKPTIYQYSYPRLQVYQTCALPLCYKHFSSHEIKFGRATVQLLNGLNFWFQQVDQLRSSGHDRPSGDQPRRQVVALQEVGEPHPGHQLCSGATLFLKSLSAGMW